ncbi:MAG: hypothetical protein KF768_00585 [Phycisphaeraceae bacterium]|nr:hypothetical protein [Phycisphaeraceae bacterium]
MTTPHSIASLGPRTRTATCKAIVSITATIAVFTTLAALTALASCSSSARTPDSTVEPTQFGEDPRGLALQLAEPDLAELSRSWFPIEPPADIAKFILSVLKVPNDRAVATSDYPFFMLAIDHTNDRAWLLQTGSIDGGTTWYGSFPYTASVPEVVERLSAAR